MFQVLLDQHGLLRGDLLFELIDLVVHYLQFALHLGDFVLRLDQVLGVEVTVRAYRLVQVLLLLQLGLILRDLLLVVKDLHLTYLDIFHVLEDLDDNRNQKNMILWHVLEQMSNFLQRFYSISIYKKNTTKKQEFYV